MALLLYLVAAATLLVLAGRIEPRLSRRDGLVLGLLPLVETGEALLRGRVLAPIDSPWRYEPLRSTGRLAGTSDYSPGILHDLWSQLIPWQAAVRDAWRAGEWPLWNPFALCGEPLLGSYQPAPFHPLHLVSLLLPLGPSLTFVAASTLLLSALSLYLLARELELAPGAALFGAAAWSYSGYLLFWLGWPVALAGGVVPLALLGALRVARQPGRSSALLLAGGLAFLFLAGNPESVLLGGVTAAALFAIEIGRPALRGRRWRPLAFAALGFSLAVGTSAIQLLPFLEALPQTARFRAQSAGEPPELRSGSWRDAARTLEESVAPFVAGVDRSEPALDREKTPPDERRRPSHREVWGGSLTLAFALLGAILARRRERLVFGALALFGLAIAAKLPGPAELLSKLPFFDLVSSRYGALLGTLGLVILAAAGLDAAIGADRRRAMAIAGAVVAGAMLALLALRSGELLASTLAPRELLLLATALLLPLLGMIGAPWLLRSASAGVPLFLVLLLVSRQVESGDLHRSFPAELMPSAGTVAALVPEEPLRFRVAGTGARFEPSLATLFGLEDARGYNPMLLERFAETIPLWGRRAPHQVVRVDRIAPFLSFLNVGSVFVGAGQELPEGWTGGTGRGGWRIAENPAALERAFVPRSVRVGGGAGERLADLSRRTDFVELAWLEIEGRDTAEPSRTIPNAEGRVELLASGFRYRLRTTFERPGWVVVSATGWRGWRAETRRGRLPVAVANHAFVAFEAPAGEEFVELAYRPRAFDFGLWITLTALTALGGGLAASRVRRRR